MTLAEFKFLLQPAGLLDSTDRDINISYTGSRIEAIAVRIQNNNLIQLQQATTLVLRAPQAGSVLNISLENSQVPVRTVNREQVGNYYLYSFVEQDQQPVMTTIPSPTGILPSEDYFTDVVILPSTQAGVFQGSDYDVLLNNSMNNRPSTYIQISDRAERSGSSANPVNLPSILQDNAILANVQDSNYTVTGWINARYDGTSTTKLTFGNIDPAVTGKSFQGSFYSPDITDTIISNQVEADRIYRILLHTSNTDYPEYTTTNLLYNIDGTVDATSNILPIIGNIAERDPGIAPGDLITVFGISEIMKVNSVTRIPDNLSVKFQLNVTRGWNDTTPVSYNSQPILLTKPIQIFEINRSKLLNLNKGKVYVKDNETILFIDSLGQVVSSSLA